MASPARLTDGAIVALLLSGIFSGGGIRAGGPPLSASPSWSVEGSIDAAQFGYSVASAGDVNGDGYDDVIVGAPGFHSAGAAPQSEGRVYLFHGTASGLAVAPAIWFTGNPLSQWGVGFSVASAGDVNDDGFDDVIYTASSPCRAFVHLGSPSGVTFAARWSFALNPTQGDSAACDPVVGAKGDANGDGFDDVILGQPFFDNGQSNDSPMAARAAATARAMSSSVPRAISPKASPVLGSMTGMVPPLDGSHPLLM